MWRVEHDPCDTLNNNIALHTLYFLRMWWYFFSSCSLLWYLSEQTEDAGWFSKLINSLSLLLLCFILKITHSSLSLKLLVLLAVLRNNVCSMCFQACNENIYVNFTLLCIHFFFFFFCESTSSCVFLCFKELLVNCSDITRKAVAVWFDEWDYRDILNVQIFFLSKQQRPKLRW